MDKIKLLENKLKLLAPHALDINVPVGFVVTTNGKFFLKHSLDVTPKLFNDLDSLFDYVIGLDYEFLEPVK